MANLKLRLTLIASGLIILALGLGATGPYLAQIAHDQFQPIHQAVAAFVFVGLCGVLFYGMLERGLRPVTSLTDNFRRIRLGDLDPRLPVEGPEEMQELA